MPSITTWNRLEPRCRSADLKAGLEARVHDPLWLLARQWQVGEFEGRNTGSPVAATVKTSTATLDRYSIEGRAPQVYGNSQPIEVLIEQEPIRLVGAPGDYRQAIEAGLHFSRLLSSAQVPLAVLSLYLAQYPLPIAPGNEQTISSIAAGRVIDGIRLHADLLAAGSVLPSVPAIPADQHATVFGVTRTWLAWYSSLFSEPVQAGGWSADRMEYSFAMGVAAGTDSYTAREYDGGAVDWYTFDRSPTPIAGGTAQLEEKSRPVIATPVSFRGMPARRFWEMEDASTNIGQLSAAAEDLGRILLREFALIYGNDWFQFPLSIPVGCQVDITSLTVLDTFGKETVVPHYSAADEAKGAAAGEWQMFSISPDEPSTVAPLNVAPHPLLITPSALGTMDGVALEEILMLRDELSNLVWGIERIVQGASGEPFDRATAWNISLPIVPPPSAEALPSYRLGSDVPGYWFPFFPVSGTGSKSPLQLQLGRLPTAPTGPLSRLLADMTSLFLDEVPREGVLLKRHYRFTRGPDGTPFLWIGRQRSVGKGEGRSGLSFDFIH